VLRFFQVANGVARLVPRSHAHGHRDHRVDMIAVNGDGLRESKLGFFRVIVSRKQRSELKVYFGGFRPSRHGVTQQRDGLGGFSQPPLE